MERHTQNHKLKTLAHFFDAVKRGEKTFEVRKNDRAFQTGDLLTLVRMDPEKTYSEAWPKETLEVRIVYLLQGGQFGIEPAYCVLGIEKL
jgi:ASC-1-like (ASCH) protein